ncbi:bifunctional [glutamate--ammonia ligase]-adenylyl-L-tyrosine phosphorylase/[glutamate--ammonia-ligase] adenylyltransferase [Methylomonas sp. AM2-LC]|uniref:bifunctional [glutamate--ammonia ligase]-adenylyl-L-tyrosine phosphorylase/[glutamate--ammonia-ligase] adenylyltransferase n=1 Tax=Methylomonas sp. AM2-LC TaxID=3153301 RepID=UPI003264E739
MPLLPLLSDQIQQLPKNLQVIAINFCTQLTDNTRPDQLPSFENTAFVNSIIKACVCSNFIRENWLRKPELLTDLINSGDLFSNTRRDHYATTLQNFMIDSEASLSSHLRQFRRREMLRIAWRDLAGWSNLDETLGDLTRLAETCIETALNFLYLQACQRWGTPRLADGTPFNLVVLGMGKLGAWELNFSSDIDLIFAFAEEGILNEKKEISYGEFFTRICQALVKALDVITADGFVFRTDIRLRPFGDSGPLLMTFDGMENYYLTQAREWERYAMIKARQVAGDFATGKQLATMIKPFVYRHYLDYGAFDALRDVKAQITQELKRKDRLDNIKLGPGGIREIEFIGQAFQLIRGGKDAALQQREIQVVLDVLVELELMTLEDSASLKFAYRFLRRVENHIQQYQDKQTHDLPIDTTVQDILAYSMDFMNWASFKQELDLIRAQVHTLFEEVFSLNEQDNPRQNSQLIWASNTEDEQALEALAEMGCTEPDKILNIIIEFKDSYALKRLSTKGLLVIQRLLPTLLSELVKITDNQTVTLKRILDLFAEVAGRNVYLSLLAENPQSLTQLITLSSASLWICEHLAQYPILFDELMYVRSLYEPLQQSALRKELQYELNKRDLIDTEQLMIALRQFKNLNVLRVAAADIAGNIPLMTVSDYLTWIAEIILEQTLIKAWQILGNKHGYPPNCQETPQYFAIIGYGKLGGVEMGYASDLDLVFLCSYPDATANTTGSKPISCDLFYLRLARTICQILNTKMLSGIVYEVDLRLRPNGDSGLVFSYIDRFEDYLKNQAWTWEHQALVRARFITGDADIQSRYQDIRHRILSLPRDYSQLKSEVREMREKMRLQFMKKGTRLFDLKQSKGGIADIEFLVQFGILAEAASYPALTTFTGSIRSLGLLEKYGFITHEDGDLLKQAYCCFRGYGHHQVLKGEDATAEMDTFADLRLEVERIWDAFMG